jgi:hypothetical protein
MKRNILVFPCGSEIGLEIYKSLSFSTHFEVFGGSSVEDHGSFVYQNYIGGLPDVSDPDFVEQINMIIDKYHIDLIFPAHDSVVTLLARARAEGSLRCPVATASAETCEVARSKQKTYRVFDGLLPTPKMFANSHAVAVEDFPVFLKPDVGQGSKGTFLAKNSQDLAFYTRKDPSLLILENLPGKEYTIDCFSNKEGELIFCEGRERKRISGGISVSSVRVINDSFLHLASTINGKLNFRGAWFYQVKERANGEFVLMEIAPRVAGTMGLVRCKGVNLPLLSAFDALNYQVEILENDYDIEIDRALQNSYRHNLTYKHAYIDLDDLVVFAGKVNPAMMAFIYQCRNNKVALKVLTRHSGDLAKTLQEYRLDGVFDEVTWIGPDDKKYLHIHESDAIFIDDSFAERKSVHDECGIPVFDSHMLEGLMEKF